MNPAFAIARREIRGSFGNFRIFLACLALGVAAIAAIGSVRTAVQTGLTSQAATLLGGDAEMTFTYRYASNEEKAWMNENASVVSEIIDFRSMVTIERDGETERALVQVKGVDSTYPVYGTLEIEPTTADLEGDTPKAFAESVLVDRLALAIGDSFKLGQKEFILAGTIEHEPDSTGAGFSFGPRIIVKSSALEGTGLVAPGTLFSTKYRLKLPEETDLNALKGEAESNFRDTGLRWRDSRNGTPGLTRFVDRLSSFLVLVGLAGLVVGGIGISSAVRTYLEKKTETIATLKTIGATGTTVFTIYFAQIVCLAAVGIGLGLTLGALIPMLIAPILDEVLPVSAEVGVYAGPLFEAALYGALATVIFTLWPIARAQQIKAAGLFRDATAPEQRLPAKRYIVITAALVALLVGLAAWLSGIPTLTLWSTAGILTAMVILLLAGFIVRKLASRLARNQRIAGRPGLRLALASIGGPGGDTSAVVLSLGLGLTVLATVGQIDANIRTLMSNDLPDIAPAYFVVDIQNEQLEEFKTTAKAENGVSEIESAAMLRGILTRINGEPARDVAGEHWVLRGDRGVSYSDTPPEGAELTEGGWWDENYQGAPLVSFAEEEGRELGLVIGDKITVNILGRDIELEIANFRTVDFGNMGINFIMIVNEAALAGAPHSHIATIYAEEASEASLLRSISSKFPNITAIRTRDAIERVGAALDSLASATSWGAGVTLLTGFIVLIGAAAAGERKRVFEAAVYKTLGASRLSILGGFATRSAILGAAAGFVAIFAGASAAWAVITFVMDADYRFEPISAFLIIFGGAMANLLAGLIFAARPLSTSPARVLRSKE